jgi:hypothetical protein
MSHQVPLCPSDIHSECPCPLQPKSRLPGDMPGVTRYPHPKSDKCLKSKAPASGVPARPRVFFLTPHEPTGSSFTMSNAPHRPGMLNVQRTQSMPGLLRGVERAGTQPSHEVGRVRQSHRDSSADSSIPARRGGTRNRKSRRTFDRSSQSSILSIGDFPVPENRRSRERKLGAPVGRKNLRRDSAAPSFTSPSCSTCNHCTKEPLWLNRASMERAGQRYGTRKCQRVESPAAPGSIRKSP